MASLIKIFMLPVIILISYFSSVRASVVHDIRDKSDNMEYNKVYNDKINSIFESEFLKLKIPLYSWGEKIHVCPNTEKNLKGYTFEYNEIRGEGVSDKSLKVSKTSENNSSVENHTVFNFVYYGKRYTLNLNQNTCINFFYNDVYSEIFGSNIETKSRSNPNKPNVVVKNIGFRTLPVLKNIQNILLKMRALRYIEDLEYTPCSSYYFIGPKVLKPIIRASNYIYSLGNGCKNRSDISNIPNLKTKRSKKAI